MRDFQVVLAKYLAAVFFYVVLWAPSILYFVLFQVVTGQSAADSIGAYLGAYALLLLAGMFYLSLGCLASAMTSNQIVAAAVTFAFVCMAFFLSLLSVIFLRATFLQEFSYYFSTIEHMAEFSRGNFDTRPIVYYVSMTALCLFLTLHVSRPGDGESSQQRSPPRRPVECRPADRRGHPHRGSGQLSEFQPLCAVGFFADAEILARRPDEAAPSRPREAAAHHGLLLAPHKSRPRHRSRPT